MKFLLLACTFFAGVYLGLSTNSESDFTLAIEQIQALINGESNWENE
jgi:hypothetical protein